MSDSQVRLLARRIKRLEDQALQRKQPTLGFSSIDDGAITSVDEDGVLKLILGKQFDGTQTSAVVSGPTPPQPLLPYLTPQPGALRIYWDGTFTGGAVAPMDFARVLAYAVPLADYAGPEPINQAIIVGQFTSAVGGEISVSLDPDTEYAVYLVCWTEAGRYGDASDVATAVVPGAPQGEPGEQGVPGPPGEDGQSLYTWVKYADDAAGTGMSDSPTGKTYIGLSYNQPVQLEGTDPEEYTWSLIKGADGQDGEDGADGVPGEPGADGQTFYTWIKYADTPTTGMSDDPTGKTYLGLAYNKTTATESTSYGDYSWSLIKGADGADGEDGSQGIPGEPGADGQTFYTWVKYADDAAGTGMADLPDGKEYIGLAYNKTTATESSNAGDYTWALFKGADGSDGADGNPGPPGEDGQSLYTWVKYADSSAGANMSDDPTGKDFIGLAYNKTTTTESTVPSDYTWSRYRGNEDPTEPPAGSPSIRVTGTTSSLIIEAEDIEAGTILDYHISDVEGFTPDATSLFASTSSRVLVASATGDGTPLTPEATYYIRVQARNDVGSAAFSNEILGSLNMNNVDEVVAASLVTGFVLTGQIQVGQILIDANDGISINQPGGGYILKFPSNGVDPLELTAQIVAQSLNVEDNLMIGGNGQLFGDLQLTNGITAPEVSPTIGTYHPSTLVAAIGNGNDDVSNIYHGLTEVDGTDHVAMAISFFGAGIRLFNKYTGDLAVYPDPTNGKNWTQDFHAWGGITHLGGYYYVFGTDSTRPVSGTYDTRCFLYKIDASTFNKVGESELSHTGYFGEYRPRVATDGTYIYVFWVNPNGVLRSRRTTPSMGPLDDIANHGDIGGVRRAIGDVHYGNHDGIGSAKWWVALDGGNDPVFCYNDSASGPGSRNSTYDFEKATNRIMGFTYDTERSQMISIDRYGNLHRYGRNPSDISVRGKYAWLDDNATGGTHETQPGPTRIQTIPARGYINTTVGTPPDINNDDTLNTDKATKVAGYFSQDGGSTWRRHVYQETRTRVGAWGAGSRYVYGSGWSEQDIGKIITGTGLPADTRVTHFLDSGGVFIDKTPAAANAGTTVTVHAGGWSLALPSLTDLAIGTPKTVNEFLSSAVQTPGRIRSTAAGTTVDGISEEILLKGNGQFRLGNYTHQRHYGSRKMTGSQNISSGGSPTIVNFGSTKEAEAGVTWDGANSRWIINKPGVYMVSLAIQWETNSTNRREAGIFKNGSQYAGNESPAESFNASAANQVVSVPIPCNVGDYIDARVFQNSGGNLKVNDKTDPTRHYFSIAFIST